MLSIFVAITVVSNGKLFEKFFEKDEEQYPLNLNTSPNNLLVNTI
jgi:hypothetical protein